MANNRYTEITMPKVDAAGLLALCRFAVRQLGRPLTYEERRGLESLEHALEGRDRRAFNRFTQVPTAAKPRGLDLRRKPRA